MDFQKLTIEINYYFLNLLVILLSKMLENAREWAREKSELKQKLYDIPDAPIEPLGASYSLVSILCNVEYYI